MGATRGDVGNDDDGWEQQAPNNKRPVYRRGYRSAAPDRPCPQRPSRIPSIDYVPRRLKVRAVYRFMASLIVLALEQAKRTLNITLHSLLSHVIRSFAAHAPRRSARGPPVYSSRQ